MISISKGIDYVISLNKENIERFANFIIDREMEELDEDFILDFSVDYARDWEGMPLTEDYMFGFNYYKDEQTYKFYTSIEFPGIFKDIDDFGTKLYWFFLEEYKFDMLKYANDIEVSFEEVMVVFSLLHELGHMKQCLRDINKYGDFISAIVEIKERNEVNDLENDIERFLAYRKMTTETYADKNAIMMMKKYKNVISIWINKIIELI